MRRPKKVLPPVCAPLSVGDLWQGFQGALGGKSSLERLLDVLRVRFGVKHCRFVSSGRAALSVTLLALGRLLPRRKVIIPAYTSFSVPAAVVRAGFRVTLCDIDPRTLDFDLAHLNSLVDRNTLAVVPNHLFGFPSDLNSIMPIARAGGAFVLEDAAQAMGAHYRGRMVGTIGDVGFYSLGRGKNITAVNGGIIVTNSDEIAAQLDQIALRAAPVLQGWGDFFTTAALGLFSKPHLYWLPDGLPWLELGVSKFSPEFPLEGFTPFRAGLTLAMLGKLDRFTSVRRANAERYQWLLDGFNGVEVVASSNGSEPGYLRLPVLMGDSAARAGIAASLRAAGLGISTAYPVCLADVEGLQPYLDLNRGRLPGARSVAARILTLPTHSLVTPTDIARICQALRVDGHSGASDGSDPVA